jgi:cobalamin biosynthesis Mg chelatase CobN
VRCDKQTLEKAPQSSLKTLASINDSLPETCSMAKDTAEKASKDTKPTKSADAASAASTTDAPKADTADSSASTQTAGPKKSSSGSRPISHFSSVTTPEYRSGWADIFGPKGKAAPSKKAKPKLPASLSISWDDLDADGQAALEAIARKLAKKKRLNYNKLEANGQIDWHISCEISDD